MAKWADYLISSRDIATINNHRYISRVILHVDNGDTVGTGQKKTKDEVIQLLDNGKTVKTIRWNYATANWSEGAVVQTEKVNGVRYLRTHPDASVADNLENMLSMSSLGL